MTKRLNGFQATLAMGWLALCAAGLAYARYRGIPGWAATPALAAFLIEYSFYLVPAFPEVRERFSGWRLPAFLVAATVLPYLACCCGAIPFQWISLGKLAALALALGFWYFALPAAPLTDLEREELMRAAVAYSLANDQTGLDRLRTNFMAKMKGSPSAAAFAVVTERIDLQGIAFRDTAAKVASVDTLKMFMTEIQAKTR